MMKKKHDKVGNTSAHKKERQSEKRVRGRKVDLDSRKQKAENQLFFCKNNF